MTAARPFNRASHHTGMTLVELLMALAITALVTLAAAGMLSAVTHGSAERTDMRSLIVRQEMISQRLSAAARASRQVLASDGTQLVLWMTDANHDGLPQVGEVRWIVFSQKDGTLTSTHVKFPESLSDEQRTTLDRAYVAGQKLQTQLTGLGSYVVTEPWATEVADWQLAAREPSDSRAGLLSYRVTFTDHHHQRQTIVGAAALRSQ